MKKLLGTIGCLILSQFVFAQTTWRGTVFSADKPLQNASVEFRSNDELKRTITNEAGKFNLNSVASSGTLTVSFAGFKTYSIAVDRSTNDLRIELESSEFFLEPLEVRSIRASEKAPFAKSTVTKAEIEKQNLGQDLPFLLNRTPSVVVNSDAGNGVGYTGIRIRGSDATRINVTLNGIPYNDAESQGTFFVDLPDIASSVSSIQVQRGVGTSSNGAGAFGATINVSTNELNDKSYAEINNSLGSFNTWKHTVKAGTGLLNDHFTVDARLSQITSDGYIDRAATSLRSYYVSGAYVSKKASVRLNVFSGKERTYQAWNGVPEWELQNNRRMNSAGTEKPGTPYENEVDNYQQNHYQLFYNQAFNNNLSLQVAGFLTRGFGYYEQYKAQVRYSAYGLPNPIVNGSAITRTDIVRQLWLDNYFYGNTASLQYKKNNDQITLGAAWNKYDGKHYGKIIWAQVGVPKDHKWYDLTANKIDISSFVKWQHAVNSNLSLYADVQYRHVEHEMNGFRNNPSLHIDRKFDFVNPKLGVTYTKNNWQSFFSYAMAAKEPNRDDFEASLTQQPKAEKLHDFEFGTSKKFKNGSVGLNAYYMFYKDQLILTGKINDVGAYNRTNVDKSYRAGIELEASYNLNKYFSVDANATFSRNKIKNFMEFFDDYDQNKQESIQHTNTDIAFSPAIISNLNLTYKPCETATVELINKYVSKQYLDNTQNNARVLDAFFTQDVRLNYNFIAVKKARVNVIFQLNNLFNVKYEPNGYTFSYIAGGAFTTENYYFPMAERNFTAGLNIKF
jgi:iron complex outermembrane receptor protein